MNRFLIYILLISTVCLAQEAFDHHPLGGMVGVSFGRIPQTDFTSKSGSFESRWGGINAIVPVFRSMNTDDDERSFQQISLTGSLRRNTTDFSLLAEPRVVTTGWLGGTWSYMGKPKNLYFFSGNIGFEEDKLIGGSPVMRFRLMVLGSYYLSDPMLLMYGASFSALFGRDLLLPILGLRWNMGDGWTSAVMLPFSISLRYRANGIVSFRAALTAAGDRIQVANHGDFAGYSNNLQVSITGAKLSLQTMVKLSNTFGLHVEFGSISRRTMTMLSGSIVVVKEQLNASRFFSLGLHYRFSAEDNTPVDED